MAQAHLTTLEGVSVTDAHGRLLTAVLAQSKRLALLIYLAVANGRPRRRDKVVSLFWPELDDEHARGALRQALSYLRRALGEGVILSRGEDLWVDTARIEVDALMFEQACAEGRFEDAMTVYNGDFLEGFFVAEGAPELDRWVDDERARLRRSAHKACSEIARAKIARGQRADAVSWARRATELAPNGEAELRSLILLLAEVGDRAGAVEAYEVFARRLAADFEVEPSAETQAVIQRIRTQTAPSGPRVEAHENASAVPSLQPEPLRPHSAASVRRRRSTALYFVAIGLLALAGYIAALSAGRFRGARDNLRIAVLPITDLGGDSSQSYIADGLTDQLITELAQLPGIEAINRRTMMEYGRAGTSVADIMRALKANALLTASIQRLADTVHMTAQLIRAGDAKAFWARSFAGSRADLLRLQQRIALSAARSLNVVITNDTAAVAARDPAALDLYVRGRYAWNQRGRGALLASIDLFRQALDIDPTFALAYSGMGDAYVQLGYGSFLRPDDAFLKARAAAERALDLDSTLAEPHATLAFVAMYYDWDWRTARQEFERALARNPSYATAHEWLGLFETAMGGFAEAIAHERRAQQLDPLSVPIAGTAGWVLYYSGRVDDAARELQIALRQSNAFPLGHFYLGRVFEARGQFDSALVHYEATGALKEWVPTIAARGYLFGRQQNEKQARAALARMDSLAHLQYVTAYAVALVHAALAQPDSAFAWLDRALAERTHWLVWLNRDPRWAALRSDPRFAELVQRVGLPR